MGPIHVKTEVFEGPFELLLSLIEKRKLFINEISLSKIADDYIAFAKTAEKFSLADSAQFILIASTLVLIKSRSLLPYLQLSEEEERSIEDLELRLKIYKRIRELCSPIKEKFGAQILFLPNERKREPVFSPQKNYTLSNFLGAIKDVLKNLPQKELIPQAIVRKVVSLEETIGNLTRRITESLRMNFGEFTNLGKNEKVEVIVGFLAMLELVKQGVIRVTQDKVFEDIIMESADVGTPRYGI